MLKVDPIPLAGEWREGYALDLHTSKALFLGYNQYDRPEFDTTYTPIGKLLHDLKYSNDRKPLFPSWRLPSRSSRSGNGTLISTRKRF